MKKILLLVSGLVLIGGLTYWASGADYLQGAYMMLTNRSSENRINQLTTGVQDLNAVNTATSTNDLNPLNTNQRVLNTATQSNTLSCSSVSFDPDGYTVSSNEEAAAGVDFNITIALKANTAAYNAKNLEAFTLPPNASWDGNLIVSSTGSGTFSDSKGHSGSTLTIPATENRLSFDLTYSDGAAGDTLSAYIENEQGCHDEFPIVVDKEASQSTSTLVCSDLDIQPDTYTLSSGESSMSFTVKVTASAETSWSTLVKNMLTFTMGTTGNSNTLGNLIVETDGDGTLSNNKNSKTGQGMVIPLTGTANTVKVTYKAPTAGDTLSASIEGQENLCSDSLSLTAQSSQPSGHQNTQQTNQNTQTTNNTQSTQTTSNNSSSTALTPDQDTIISSSDYVCSSPFTDIGTEEWYTDLVCRMYQAQIVNGRSSTTFAPAGFLTYAEAIKVLVLEAGYTKDDATGLSTDFLDVSSGDWYYPYIVIAESKDVIRTRDAGAYFNPNNPIPRGWFVLYAARMAGETLSNWDANDIPFTDLEKSDPYTYAIILANETIATSPNGREGPIVEGYSDGTFKPDSFIQRSEAMAIAQRIYLAWFK